MGPVTRSDLAAEPFPLDVFPPPLGDLCRQGALSLHCPPDYFAVAALGIAGGAMGRSVALKVKSTWEVYGNLFVAVVGAPGSKKSPAQKIVSRPLWILDRELRARHKEELAEHRNRSKGGADAGDLPTRDHAVIDDATREAFVKALSENSRGLIVVKDELTAWVASLNAYKPSGRGDDKQFWMSLNSNAPVKVNRKMNQDDFLIYPSFGSVVGCLTPGTLPMIRESKADDGWIDRILFSYPEPLPLARRWTDAEISRDILDDWTQAVRRLFSRPMVRDDDGHDRPSFVGLDADAHVQWESWYNAHNAEQCVPNFPGYLLGPWSKLEGFTLRFALILSQLRQAYDPRGGGEPRDIDVLVMRDAFRLTAYFKNHFRRARGELIRRPDGLTHDARDVIQWLRDHPRDSFTGRDVLRRFPQFDDHDRDDAISSLISQRYIRRCPTPPRPPGKRGQSPSPVYEVNPSLFRADRIDCIDGIPSDDCHDSNSVNRVNSVSPKNGSVNGTPPSTVAPSPRVLTWLVCFLTFKPASAGRVAEEACRESIGREELDAAAGVLGIERFVEDGIEHWKLTTT